MIFWSNRPLPLHSLRLTRWGNHVYCNVEKRKWSRRWTKTHCTIWNFRTIRSLTQWSKLPISQWNLLHWLILRLKPWVRNQPSVDEETWAWIRMSVKNKNSLSSFRIFVLQDKERKRRLVNWAIVVKWKTFDWQLAEGESACSFRGKQFEVWDDKKSIAYLRNVGLSEFPTKDPRRWYFGRSVLYHCIAFDWHFDGRNHVYCNGQKLNWSGRWTKTQCTIWNFLTIRSLTKWSKLPHSQWNLLHRLILRLKPWVRNQPSADEETWAWIRMSVINKNSLSSFRIFVLQDKEPKRRLVNWAIVFKWKTFDWQLAEGESVCSFRGKQFEVWDDKKSTAYLRNIGLSEFPTKDPKISFFGRVVLQHCKASDPHCDGTNQVNDKETKLIMEMDQNQ